MSKHRSIAVVTIVAAAMACAIGVTPVAADPPLEDCDQVGTEGDDTLYGTDGPPYTRERPEIICALGGNDRILHLYGHHVVYAGPGDDEVWGPSLTYGGEGNDTLHVYCYPDDYCEGPIFAGGTHYGGPGNDVLLGASGDDRLFGGSGDDRLEGHTGDDLLNGGKGNDLLVGERHHDVLKGGPGRDVLKGQRGKDRLYGQRGPDTLWGGRGPDRLFGNRGQDTLHANDGDPDRLDGGPGSDEGEWDGQDRVDSVERRLR